MEASTVSVVKILVMDLESILTFFYKSKQLNSVSLKLELIDSDRTWEGVFCYRGTIGR